MVRVWKGKALRQTLVREQVSSFHTPIRGALDLGRYDFLGDVVGWFQSIVNLA